MNLIFYSVTYSLWNLTFDLGFWKPREAVQIIYTQLQIQMPYVSPMPASSTMILLNGITISQDITHRKSVCSDCAHQHIFSTFVA